MIFDTSNDTVRRVVIMLTDMVGYSRTTHDWAPAAVRDFVIDYHRGLNRVINREEFRPVEIEPSAGDGAVILFTGRPGENSDGPMVRRAVEAAVALGVAVAKKEVVATRIGLFRGEIVEARVGERTAKFGAGFAVANRLEELCDFFNTPLLMDRDMAVLQTDRKFLVNIGKATPQNLKHPLHLLSIYKPGLHHIPASADPEGIAAFVTMKNAATELFYGNKMKNVDPDFPRAREMLNQAKELFYHHCGTVDIATERILEFIRHTPYPAPDFPEIGMKVSGSKHEPLGVRLFHLSSELLKAIDPDFYYALVVNTDWENFFALEWYKEGDVIFRVNDPADGIYYINSGTVVTLDENGRLIVTLGSGNIFGEMAYFSKERRRNATIIAASDLVLRKISTNDFQKLPVIQKIFERIASQRRKEGAAGSS